MTMRIPGPAAPLPSSKADATSSVKGTQDASENAKKVGRDFEAILVRQMLSSTHVAGRGGGYSDMAVESLASSISAAGGLGMSRIIEQALSRASHPAAPSMTLPSVSEKK
jgi:Rod binding domain-containing protein